MMTKISSTVFLGFFLFSVTSALAEEDIRTIHRSGPRVGLTSVTGELAERLKEEHDAEPLFSQFGWNFEQVMPAGQGNELTVVWQEIILVGGLDQNLIVPGFTFILGLRTGQGVQFGIGPNILFDLSQLGKDEPEIKSFLKTAVVFGLGMSIPAGRFNFPIDIAFTPSTTGLRTTVLAGVTW